MKVLIFGASGQDGSYLIESLLKDQAEIYAVVRRNSVAENQDYRLSKVAKNISTIYGDITDTSRVTELISKIKPDYVYNLAAQSHVRVSFELPSFTLATNGLAVNNILEAIRHHSPGSTMYQASSSEMFGLSIDEDGRQRETTPMRPVSPYGSAKLLAFNLSNLYRESYELQIFNGILFNHESPRRGSNFVTSKIAQSAVMIKLGVKSELILGNLDASRDWGHSRDYVEAMRMIVESKVKPNYVVSTGSTRTVRDFCRIAFAELGLDWERFVKVDEKYFRPNELPYLCGDSSQIRNDLGWSPETSFEDLVCEMIEHWHSVLSKNCS